MRKRFIMLASGGSAGVVVLATCLLLIQSGEVREMTKSEASALAIAETPAPAPPPPSSAARPSSQSVSSASYTPASPAVVPEAGDTPPATDPIAVSVPRLAYAYVLGYRLAGARIAQAQQAHVTLCENLGPTRCQLMSMRHGSSDEGYANANLQLRVASGLAQNFRADLTRAIAGVGGRPAETSITAEDVSKDLVDTEARIRQREILVARLTDMLRNRSGRVSELVEAERSVAAAQEELDQARGWLGQLRARVAMSEFRINYVPAVAVEPSPRPQSGRLGDAIVQSAGAVLAFARNLLIVLIFLTPWALIALAGALLFRRWYNRFRPAPGEA